MAISINITILYYCTTPKEHFSKNLLPSLCFYFCHNVIFSNLFQSNSTLYYWWIWFENIYFLFLLLTEHFSSTILVLFNITYCFLWHNNTKFWKSNVKKENMEINFQADATTSKSNTSWNSAPMEILFCLFWLIFFKPKGWSGYRKTG